MNKIRLAFTYIFKTLGINILLVSIISILFSIYILLNGWIENSEKEYFVVEPDYSIQLNSTSYSLIEEFCQAVQSMNQDKVDRILLLAQTDIPFFQKTNALEFRIASIYPHFSDPNMTSYFQSKGERLNHFALFPADFANLCSYILPYDENGHLNSDSNLSIPDAIHVDADNEMIAWEGENGFTYYFQKVLASELNIPNQYNYLFIPWSQMKTENHTIAEIHLCTSDNLSDTEIENIDRVSSFLFNQTLVYPKSHIDSPYRDIKIFVYSAVICAVFSLIPLIMYAFDLRRRELAVLSICGETSTGIFIHALIHFTLLLCFSEFVGIAICSVISFPLRNTALSLSLYSLDEFVRLIVFHILSTIVFAIYLVISKEHRKVCVL